ncbi:hypothetical protein ACF05T_13615 [Streptomyces lateritius]|uniref:Uncharacterized protein n=1 Tax=Streptomyces lateritius TaxID=67313 RepID=A0ABW6YBB5_9ACTN
MGSDPAASAGVGDRRQENRRAAVCELTSDLFVGDSDAEGGQGCGDRAPRRVEAQRDPPAPPEVTVRPGYPNTVNDVILDGEIATVHRELFGSPTVFDFGPAMGSEDFSLLAPEGYDYWYVTSTPPTVWEAAPGTDLAEKFGNVPGTTAPCSPPTRRCSSLVS